MGLDLINKVQSWNTVLFWGRTKETTFLADGAAGFQTPPNHAYEDDEDDNGDEDEDDDGDDDEVIC